MSVNDAESTKTALVKHENTDLTPYATKNEVGQQIQDITNVLNTNTREIVTGKVYIYEEEQYTAQVGAEIFNDYENNIAVGDYSNSEGSDTKAIGDYSNAEGSGTSACGFFSHAEGGNSTASGLTSHAEGFRTISSGKNSHVMGKCNIEDTEDKYAFIIGNGESDEARSNAFAVDWEGNIYIGNSNTAINLSDLLNRIEALERNNT